ncbi:MAG: hypothetical protein K0R51_1261 [Cytophagaceae bacterium]|jgi:hypothetical protein|nr:hypothetical protein [Cytophagaceae bacterium]
MKKVSAIFFICIVSLTLASFQLFKTNLRITVRNELGNLESGATVAVYKTKEDYEKSVNPVALDKTDAKGIVTYEDMEAIAYYVTAEKGDRNNFGAAEKTEPLTANKMNKMTIIISE